jgi:hypothetical protein
LGALRRPQIGPENLYVSWDPQLEEAQPGRASDRRVPLDQVGLDGNEVSIGICGRNLSPLTDSDAVLILEIQRVDQ